jgi:hypothetical protein
MGPKKVTETPGTTGRGGARSPAFQLGLQFITEGHERERDDELLRMTDLSQSMATARLHKANTIKVGTLFNSICRHGPMKMITQKDVGEETAKVETRG